MQHINLYSLFQQLYPKKNCAIRFESEVIRNDDSSIKGFTFKADYTVIKTVIKEWKMFCSYEFIAPYSVFNEYETLTNCSGLYNATKTLAFASYFCKMRVKILYS